MVEPLNSVDLKPKATSTKSLKLVTWNSLGNPCSKDIMRHGGVKGDMLVTLLKDYDYVLLQEAGTIIDEEKDVTKYLRSEHGLDVQLRGMPQAGAKNPRCTTAIASRYGFPDNEVFYYTLPSATGRFGMLITVNWAGKNVGIGTLHTEASKGAAGDQTAFLKSLEGKMIDESKAKGIAENFQSCDCIIIGGDFNNEPPNPPSDDLSGTTSSGASIKIGTRWRSVTWKVHSPTVSSHYSKSDPNQNKVFDYFVSRGVKDQGTVIVDPSSGPLEGSAGSDHKWVGLTVTL